MKIAFIIPTLGAGGAERVFSLMANYWADKDFEVIILSLDDPANSPFFLLNPKVKYYPLNLLKEERSIFGKIKRTMNQILTTRSKVKELAPDVIIAQLDIAIFLAITSTIFRSVKSLVYEGNNPYLNTTNKYLQKLNDYLYRFADRIILQTHQIAKTFPQNLQHKISVIYNPITTPPVQLEENDYPRNFQYKKIVSVGRLEYQKGYDTLLNAFHLFLQKRPDWELIILGEGKQRPELEKLCDSLNIMQNVSLPGRVKDPFNKLKDSSIYVLSSRFEGLPNALCEAMSMGLPVVASRCKFGPEEIIRHYENGLLVPVEDSKAIANAFEELADDFALGKKLGTQAKNIMKICSPEVVMQQWEDLINRLLQDTN